MGSALATQISIDFNFIPFGGNLVGSSGDIAASTTVTCSGSASDE